MSARLLRPLCWSLAFNRLSPNNTAARAPAPAVILVVGMTTVVMTMVAAMTAVAVMTMAAVMMAARAAVAVMAVVRAMDLATQMPVLVVAAWVAMVGRLGPQKASPWLSLGA